VTTGSALDELFIFYLSFTKAPFLDGHAAIKMVPHCQMDQHLHQNHDQLNLPNYQQGVATLYEQRHQLPPAAQEALF